MNLNDICVRHWIVTDKITVRPTWKIDTVIHPTVGKMYRLPIADSIHYNALVTGDFSEYKCLIETTAQTDHTVEKFKELLDKFDSSKLSSDKIKIDNEKCVVDGVHRLAIMRHKGIAVEYIQLGWVEFLDIHYPS